jgi:hypothetical protein
MVISHVLMLKLPASSSLEVRMRSLELDEPEHASLGG